MFEYNAKEYRDGFRQMLRELNGDCFLTFNFNCEVSHPTAQSKMVLFFNKLQDKVFGPRWCEQYDRLYPQFLGFRERKEKYRRGRAGYPHYHGVGKFDEQFKIEVLREGPPLWRGIVPGGSLDAQRAECKEAVLRYATKDIWNDEACESVFIYCDTREKRPKRRAPLIRSAS